MRQKLFQRSAVVLVLAMYPLIASGQNGSQDQAAIRETVEQFYDAYVFKATDKMNALWSKRSPDFAVSMRRIEENISKYEIEVKELRITKIKVADARAWAHVSVKISAVNAGTGKASDEIDAGNLVFQLVKEDGVWRIWRVSPLEKEIADALAATEDKQRRAGLIRERDDLFTTDLVASLYRKGDKKLSENNFDDALWYNDLALEIAEAIGDKPTLAWCHLYRGFILSGRAGNDSAAEEFRLALQLFREAGDRKGVAVTLSNLGTLAQLAGKYDEALAAYQQNLQVLKDLGQKLESAAVLDNIGEVYRLSGKFTEAAAAFQDALKLQRENDDREGAAKTLADIARLHASTGDPLDALKEYEQSASLFKELGRKADAARTTTSVGTIYNLSGQYMEALRAFEFSAGVFKELDMKAEESGALGDIGNVYGEMGRYADALVALDSSLKLAKEAGDRGREARTRVNTAVIYRSTGKYDEALETAREGLKIFRELNMKAEEAAALIDIGGLEQKAGRYEVALELYGAALKIFQELSARRDVAGAQSNIAYVNAELGHYDEALGALRESLKIIREGSDRADEALFLNNMGVVLSRLGKGEEALSSFRTALEIAEPAGETDTAIHSYWGIGDYYRSQKDWPKAAEAYGKAIGLTEQTRLRTREQSFQTSFFKQYVEPYHSLIETLLEQGRKGEALATSERAKARTLVDLMQREKTSLFEALSEEERQREESFSTEEIYIAGQVELARKSGDRALIEHLEAERKTARANHDAYLAILSLRHPARGLQDEVFSPATLDELSMELFAKVQGVCILSFVVGENGVFLFALTLGQGTLEPVHITVYRLKDKEGHDLNSDGLEGLVRSFRAACAKESGPYKGYSRDLYDLLLAPAERELKGKTHLVIIPDGVLNMMPFQALLDARGTHLIENYSLSYAPSVTALLKMLRLGDQRRRDEAAGTTPMLSVGIGSFQDNARYRDRPLPNAERQAESVAKLFGVTALTGDSATKAKIIKEMPAARRLHFSTHGEANDVAPLYSSLILRKGAGDDGSLYARDLLDLSLRADMVVLSACETGLGQQVNGEGVLGLSWAFAIAGAPSSFVTQWSVQEESTNLLVTDFYNLLRPQLRNGTNRLSKAEALQQAQKKLASSKAYSHPYFWAPFILIGDWR